jgi:hypothetical protein
VPRIKPGISAARLYWTSSGMAHLWFAEAFGDWLRKLRCEALIISALAALGTLTRWATWAR